MNLALHLLLIMPSHPCLSLKGLKKGLDKIMSFQKILAPPGKGSLIIISQVGAVCFSSCTQVLNFRKFGVKRL